ncbi:dolichyl-di-phosphooligosaccharide-protein glycotransferase, putative [Eimeria praecox]|uniref:Dolichyl-di-phosphooligosaccharide-protein glycotransferase, putative n=1 Tax=Eimeria praecox TaxID=51316 RepID=U6G8T7_9EIME|nr:dolichyl-di-phosphooligosaccharide-protein glycotransferase, putative [Eimeria praecox]
MEEMKEQTANAILEWFDGGGEESQGADHEQHQQHRQQQQLPQLLQEDPQQQQEQQYYSPLEKSRSLLLLLGPGASPSLLQLAAALFGSASIAPSFLQEQAADLFGAVSLNRPAPQQQKQQQPKGTVFVARELLEGHPHVVTPLAEDELLLYSGGYHMGALQVGCGVRECEKEPLPPYAFPLLLAPPTAFGVDRSGSSSSSHSGYSSSSSSRMAFASALQTRGNNRVLLLSGPQACSDAFTGIDYIPFAGSEFRVVNKRFCIEAAAWALNRQGVLRWSNVKHHKVGGETSRLYTVGDLLRFSVDLHELREGVWRPFEGTDVQVEYVLGDPLLRLFLQREADSPTFSVEFKPSNLCGTERLSCGSREAGKQNMEKAPDRAGILKFVLRHARLGYSSLLIRE